MERDANGRPQRDAEPKTAPSIERSVTSKKAPSPHGTTLVVGVGASAGGLEALQEFVGALPTKPTFAVVVVTHQHPTALTLLPELLSRSTECAVATLESERAVAPATVYVTSPGFSVQLEKGVLKLAKGGTSTRPIDDFFRSLAHDQAENAVAVVLSGTGTDGTLGAVDVKTAGGLVLAQSSDSARFAGMPSSVVAAGVVDAVMAPAEMPAEILAYLSRHTSEEHGERRENARRELDHVLAALRSRTSHDFSGYKKSTLLRRIDRRLSHNDLRTLREYARYVDENPGELDVLFREVLIGVTCFFRDGAAFECFAAQLRLALAVPRDDGPFRIWVCACATGEEAYSVAMVYKEVAAELGIHTPVQVFATDLDPHAIDVARAGRYPLTIAEHVSEERLQRFFVKGKSEYRIHREIREVVVFAVQNVVKDPPFTRLDAVTCRNLLIYLEQDVQRRVLGLFCQALGPGGLLMLGGSESLGRFDEAFEQVDKKQKVFRRRLLPNEIAQEAAEPPRAQVERLAPGKVPASTSSILSHAAERTLLLQLAPPSVLVNARGDISYFHGRTGLFLEPPAGEPVANLFSMAREGLRLELPLLLRQAATSNEAVVRTGLQVKSEGGVVSVRLTVRAVQSPDLLRGCFIVSFERDEPPASKMKKSKSDRVTTDGKVAELELELLHTRENLQGTIEELETSNEELKSTNEELQSTNEELQSANEELETSREEMQSLNEELQTVNSELEERNRALSQVNDDMQNLLNSTDVATVFLDDKLAIRRFTTPARQVFSLIETDIGRPISDLTANLRYESLVDDAREVLRTLVYREREIQTKDGAWRLIRIMPYRTAYNVIDGLVITFIDIDRIRREERAAEEARALGEDVMESLPSGVAVLDEQLRVLQVNKAFLALFGTTQKRLLGEPIGSGLEGPWSVPALQGLLEQVLASGRAVKRELVARQSINAASDHVHVSAQQLASSVAGSRRIVLVVEQPFIDAPVKAP